jgi:hypothetical protein
VTGEEAPEKMRPLVLEMPPMHVMVAMKTEVLASAPAVSSARRRFIRRHDRGHCHDSDRHGGNGKPAPSAGGW